MKPTSVSVEADARLADRTSLGLGGPARFLATARSEADIVEALAWADEQQLDTWVLGGGSNVVVPDVGLPGLVLAIALAGIEQLAAGGRVVLRAQAGEAWEALVRHAVMHDLQGLECLSGIPGLVGATPIQNVGAYGQEVADTIVAVRAFDRTERRFVELGAADCEFGYRVSRFKKREPHRFVISAVTFALQPGAAPDVRYPELQRALERTPHSLQATREAVLALRRGKSMLLDRSAENGRSCGSFFMNPVVTPEQAQAVQRRFADETLPRYPQADGLVKLPAAWLIERSGFAKGYRRGRVGISSRHSLALVCHAGATTQDLLELAALVRATVLARSGVELTPEPVIW